LAGCCECGDEPSGSGATELVTFLGSSRVFSLLMLHARVILGPRVMVALHLRSNAHLLSANRFLICAHQVCVSFLYTVAFSYASFLPSSIYSSRATVSFSDFRHCLLLASSVCMAQSCCSSHGRPRGLRRLPGLSVHPASESAHSRGFRQAKTHGRVRFEVARAP
jgi:hypothetical protein